MLTDRRTSLEVLARGTLDGRGPARRRVSNATLLALATLDGVEVTCVYKPIAGERPLWDFPDGTLGLREVAAYEVSAALGWDVVPPTVWREDGPFGQGMAQAWITPPDGGEMDPAAAGRRRRPGKTPPGWLEVLDAHGAGGDPVTLVHADDPDLRRMCVFDALVNNADRKGGHVLHGACSPTRAGDVRRRPRRHASARTRSCAPCCGAGRASALEPTRSLARPRAARRRAGRAISASTLRDRC